MTTFADKLEDVDSIEEAEALFQRYISPVYPSLSLGNWIVGKEGESDRAWAAIGEELSGKTFYVDWEIGYADASIEIKDPEPDDCEEEPDDPEESQSESDHWMTAIHEIFFEIDFGE